MKNNLDLIYCELKVLLREKLLYPVILIPAILMVVGINSINLSNDMVMHDIARTTLTIALGSAKYGALSIVLAFSMINILTLSKDKTKRMEQLINSLESSSKLIFIRLISIIIYGLVSIIIGMLLTIIVQIFFYKVHFEFSPYIYCYGLITLPALIFAVFISTGIYLICESIDISIIFMLVLFFVGFLSSKYLLNWAHGSIIVFSDFAGLRPVLKLLLYNRILWSAVSIGVLALGFICRRKFQFSLIKSVKFNGKNIFLVAIIILSLISTAFIYVNEPYCSSFMPSNNLDINYNVYLKDVQPHVAFFPSRESIDAEVSYNFKNNNADYISFLKNEGLNIKSITVNGKKCEWSSTPIPDVFSIKIPKDDNINVKIKYDGKIKYYKGGAVAGYICSESIYLLENSCWLFKPLTNSEKLINIEGSYSMPSNLCVITPGITEKVKEKNSNKIWNFKFKSQDINIGVFAGNYKKASYNINGKFIEFYYSPKHEQYIKKDLFSDGKTIEKYIENMFSYYTNTFGEYYTDEYPLKIVETSIYKSGGHSSGNVITFAEYMVNRDIGSRNVYMEAYTMIHDLNIIAHEMSHQWWGTGVDVKDDNMFSSEGFAEYSSFKYIQKEFNDGYLDGFVDSISNSWEDRAETLNKSYYLKSAENLEKLNKSYKERYLSEISSINRYDKMPNKLLKLEKTRGEKTFLSDLSKIYEKNLYGNLTYDQFLKDINESKEEFESE